MKTQHNPVKKLSCAELREMALHDSNVCHLEAAIQELILRGQNDIKNPHYLASMSTAHLRETAAHCPDVIVRFACLIHEAARELAERPDWLRKHGSLGYAESLYRQLACKQ